MQLSHDDNVVFTSSKGFWRANSIGASSEGMATPQERCGLVKSKETVRLWLWRCRPADISSNRDDVRYGAGYKCRYITLYRCG